MTPRQNLVEIFSTFIQFEGEQFSRWASDPHLRRSMKSCLEQRSQGEKFWALYWYKAWQSQHSIQLTARSHLSAYLQEACYWAAHKAISNFSQTQYTLSDGFQIAIAQLDRVLRGFNAEQGFNLKNYASAVFANGIRETLRQRQEIDICTPWALLRKLSQKRLVESLQMAGLNSDAIARRVLAWKGFKTLYVPTIGVNTRQLSKPDLATWEAIAAYYNQERNRQLSPGSQEGDRETLEKWLLDSAKAARSYLYPSFTSIDTPIPGQEAGELGDYLPATQSESLLADIIVREEEQTKRSQQEEINRVLTAALDGMDEFARQLLQLYYEQQLTQQQIAKHLDTKQYTISRRLTKIRQSLLLTLCQWSQENLHISLTSDVIDRISTLLEEWLTSYYRAAFPPFP